MAFSYSQPRRRRRGVWLLAVLSVVVVVVVLVTSFRSERRVLADYLDVAHQAAADSSTSAVDFEALLARLSSVERQEFITTLAGLRATLSEASAIVESAEVPSHGADAQARLSLAGQSWLRGLDLIEGGLLDAADRPDEEPPAVLIERGVIQLAVGDFSYEEAVRELKRLQAVSDVDFPDYPEAAFAPSGGVVALIEQARAATGLALRRDAAITSVGFDPRPLGSTELGEAIIPLTNQLVITVTILNQGNERLTNVSVDVQLLGDRAGSSARAATDFDFLVPGESTTFEATFDVVPVVQYDLRVTVPVTSGETEVENNVFTERFVVNQES